MYSSEQEKSKAMIAAEEKRDRAIQLYRNEVKKENAKKRKWENHHKYMMGGIVVKYFPECYRFEEDELNRILGTAIKTPQCQQVIDKIKEECMETANNELNETDEDETDKDENDDNENDGDEDENNRGGNDVPRWVRQSGTPM